MTDRILPDNIKLTVDTLLHCGDAEFAWLKMGMGLMLKAIAAEITDKFLFRESCDLVTWVARSDNDLHGYSREELAKMLLRWYNAMEDFKRAP